MDENDTTLDHIIPQSKGGKKGGNIALAHNKCNSSRSSKYVSVIVNWQEVYGLPVTDQPINRLTMRQLDQLDMKHVVQHRTNPYIAKQQRRRIRKFLCSTLHEPAHEIAFFMFNTRKKS